MQDGPLAQMVEQLTLNQRVVGSSPTRPTIRLLILQGQGSPGPHLPLDLAGGESGGMADASRLGRDGATRGGSTPPSRTSLLVHHRQPTSGYESHY